MNLGFFIGLGLWLVAAILFAVGVISLIKALIKKEKWIVSILLVVIAIVLIFVGKALIQGRLFVKQTQVIAKTKEGTIETTYEEMDDLSESNSVKFNKIYGDAYLTITGEVTKIDSSTYWNEKVPYRNVHKVEIGQYEWWVYVPEDNEILNDLEIGDTVVLKGYINSWFIGGEIMSEKNGKRHVDYVDIEKVD